MQARVSSLLAKAISGRALPLTLLLITLAISLATGLAGLDFGQHWDEGYVFDELAKSFRNGLFLPRRYNYPSVTYDLALLGSIPYVLLRSAAGESDASFGVLRASGALFKSREFLLFTRGLFLFVSVGLTSVWTFLSIRVSGRGRWEALLGAAILATSWEVVYHARWIAPDGVLMHFGALTLLLMMAALRAAGTPRSRWLVLAALSAGLACGSKYFGGIFLVPVLLAGVFPGEGLHSRRQVLGQLVALGLAFSVAFALSTPGALLEPFSFIADVRREITHYRTGHFGNSVAAGWQHAWLLAAYLGTESLSAWTLVAVVFGVFAVLGAVVLVRERGGGLRALAFLCTPVLFILYMVTQRVMIARNYLLLMPFVAILAARGIVHVVGHVRSAAPRAAASLSIAALIVMNFVWLARSAISIVEAPTVDRGAALARFLSQNDDTAFCLSASVRALLPEAASPSNLLDQAGADADCLYVFSAAELPLSEESGRKWVANRPGRYRLAVGAHDRNFDYYPWWPGDSKIIAMRASDASTSGLLEASGP